MRFSVKYLIIIILLIASPTFSIAQRPPMPKEKGKSLILESLYMPWIKDVRPLFDKPDTVSIMVIGDVMMHTKQLQYDYNNFLAPIRNHLSAADLAIANMEFTLAGKPYSGYPAFSAPDGYARHAIDCGIDVFLTANNHILDKGEKGIRRTIEQYDRLEKEGLIHYTGIALDEFQEDDNYPLIVVLKGIRIAFLNFTYGTNLSQQSKWPKVNRTNRDDILKAIERAKNKKADYIIALPHWGIEYKLRHSEAQEALAVWLADNGVDMIIGSHPHVVQDSTTIYSKDGRKVPVFYSLGNAVSNMSAINTRLELAVSIVIAKEADGKSGMLAPKVEFLWCTLPGKLYDNFGTIAVSDYLDKRSDWIDKSDYDNMMETYRRVKQATEIID